MDLFTPVAALGVLAAALGLPVGAAGFAAVLAWVCRCEPDPAEPGRTRPPLARYYVRSDN